MAPAIISSSNTFLLTTTPHSRLSRRSLPRLSVLAKKTDPDAQIDDTPNSKPFRFNFASFSDVKSLIPVISNPSPGLSFGTIQRRKDPGTVFVAGATGQAGIRIAQTLLREGFKVRAGVPELAAAQELALLASKYKIISNEELKSLNAVESNFQDAELIAKAIGNASKVVVTIGPLEYGPDAEVSTSDALLVIKAAQLAGVGHVAIIYDGNTAGTASTNNNVLYGISSFFNNLFSRSQSLTLSEFLEKVIETDVRYTLIKTSLTEDFSPESSYNVVVSAEGSAGENDYKVAKSQIASLVADVFSNTAIAENKVVEVSTNPLAPSKSIDELFSAVPEDGRRKAYAEALAKAKAKAEEEEKIATETANKLEEAKKLSEQESQATSVAEEAQEKAVAAGASMANLLGKAKGFGSGLSWNKLSSQVATAVQKTGEKPNVQVATVRGQAKARTLPSLKAVTRQSGAKRGAQKPKEKEIKSKAKPKAEVKNVFGGLFKQETIYIDDD